MKKMITFAAIAMIATVAFASSIAVPWYQDNAGDLASYITLLNQTNAPVVCSVFYSVKGVDLTPTNNTFEIGALSSIAWRPTATDGTNDVESDDVANGGVPNVDSEGVLTDPNDANSALPANFGFGSARIEWVGESSDIVGRLIQVSGADNAMYLLPPGK